MERILIIDADPSSERTLIPAFHRHGYQVRLAKDGQQAF
jgi:DNA-binding response OmpR family regulator